MASINQRKKELSGELDFGITFGVFTYIVVLVFDA